MPPLSKAVLSGREYYEFLEREREAEAIAQRVRGGQYDYDPVRERSGLVTWVAAEGRWSIVLAGAAGAKRLEQLREWGVMLFGAPPWRRSCVVSVVGRLAALEEHVAALPAPDSSFVYDFPFDLAVAGLRRPADGGAAVPHRVVTRSDRVRHRAKPPQQGRLF